MKPLGISCESMRVVSSAALCALVSEGLLLEFSDSIRIWILIVALAIVMTQVAAPCPDKRFPIGNDKRPAQGGSGGCDRDAS